MYQVVIVLFLSSEGKVCCRKRLAFAYGTICHGMELLIELYLLIGSGLPPVAFVSATLLPAAWVLSTSGSLPAHPFPLSTAAGNK